MRCALSRVAIRALEKWIAASGKKRSDYLFTGRGAGDRPMGTRQLSRLLKDWTFTSREAASMRVGCSIMAPAMTTTRKRATGSARTSLRTVNTSPSAIMRANCIHFV